MDIGAVVAALGSLGTILAFVYGIIKKPKSEEDEESSKSTQLTEIKRIIELEKEKINQAIIFIEKVINKNKEKYRKKFNRIYSIMVDKYVN